MYKALQNLRRPFISVFTFNHHSSMGGRCHHPRRVLVTQVKAGGGRLWQELRDPGSLSWMYSASTSGSQSCPECWLWHCPGCCQINLTPALRGGSVETQGGVPQSLSALTECLDQALSCPCGEGGLLAPCTPWRLCGFISSLLQIILWPLLHLCMQTFLTAGHQVMQSWNRTPRLDGIVEIIKSTSPKPFYKWEHRAARKEIACPKIPLV